MRKKWWTIFLLPLLFLGACQEDKADDPERNSVYYQIFVGSFYDSDGDGVGDLQGVIEKLDYLEDDLGVSGIWLSPIHPSPTYHKYDVVDYYGIDEDFGTLDDFRELSDELAEREMDLMMDFIFNHTSSQHPWFLEAKDAVLNDQKSDFIDYYNFSEEQDAGYTALANEIYYESQFWSEMPDLNLDYPAVRDEIEEIAKYWMEEGVTAFRLDATTHFYENQIGKNTEILSWFMDTVQAIDEEIYVVGEAWTGESIVLDMYESGIDSFFNFAFSQNDGSIVKAINKKSGQGLAEQVFRYQEKIQEKTPDAVDALFLSNHDNGRSAAYFANQLDKQKLAASIYLLMPGNSFVYYGEEIGMLGSGVDENKRLPMEWGEEETEHIPNRYAGANYHEFEIDSVAEQLEDEDSLLAHYQEAIQIKNRYPELVEGKLEVLDLDNESIYALKHDDLLVLHNFSDKDQTLRLEGEILEELNDGAEAEGEDFVLNPYSSLIIRQDKN
ncbi:MAG: hypothetical protein L0L39_00090 [Atopostipes suicloacalis]|nr:hypothetical protein [Atopostipes suicloacalis]MDN6730555.1 hypothetical protein [Atopostipes suicloacalis]